LNLALPPGHPESPALRAASQTRKP